MKSVVSGVISILSSWILNATPHRNMAPAKKRNVSSAKTPELRAKTTKIDLNDKVECILKNRKNANDVFDLLEFLQVLSI